VRNLLKSTLLQLALSVLDDSLDLFLSRVFGLEHLAQKGAADAIFESASFEQPLFLLAVLVLEVEVALDHV
jgi:hypothetical protein